MEGKGQAGGEEWQGENSVRGNTETCCGAGVDRQQGMRYRKKEAAVRLLDSLTPYLPTAAFFAATMWRTNSQIFHV